MSDGLNSPVVTAQPSGTRVQLERSPGRLDITVPPKGLLDADTLATGETWSMKMLLLPLVVFSTVCIGLEVY